MSYLVVEISSLPVFLLNASQAPALSLPAEKLISEKVSLKSR